MRVFPLFHESFIRTISQTVLTVILSCNPHGQKSRQRKENHDHKKARRKAKGMYEHQNIEQHEHAIVRVVVRVAPPISGLVAVVHRCGAPSRAVVVEILGVSLLFASSTPPVLTGSAAEVGRRPTRSRFRPRPRTVPPSTAHTNSLIFRVSCRVSVPHPHRRPLPYHGSESPAPRFRSR